MKYIDFINTFKEPIFTLQDLKIAGVDISSVQLSQWSKSNYLIKIKNGVYVFSERKDKLSMEAISHLLFDPSYISLERALSKHGVIPEIIYNCTAITTRKTMTIKNDFGVFIYRNIKKDLFFGYNKINENGNVYLLAEPEKAILDYLYLNSSKINNKDDIAELRFNDSVLNELNKKKIKDYLKIFNSKKLEQIFALIFND
jgi:predicted transcriptional regulator of viral defense system